MNLRDAAQQALEGLIESARLLGATQAKKLYGCYSQEDGRLERAWHENIAKRSATIRAALAEPAPEPVALTFAGLTVRELRIPAGMTVRIDRDTLTVAPQRDPNDPILVEPNHDPSHAPYVALAEPQPEIEQLKAERDALKAENEALQNIKHYEAPRGFVLNPDYLVPELQAERDALLEALQYAIKQVPEFATVPGIAAAIDAARGKT